MQQSWIDPRRVVAVLEERAGRRSPLPPGQVRGLEEEVDESCVRVRGRVPGQAPAAPPVELTVTPSLVEGHCACGAAAWPCDHVLALAGAWAAAAARGEERGSGRGGWKTLLGELAAARPTGAVESGRHGVVHWLSLEGDRSGCVALVLAWREHRWTARGMGRGRPLPPARLLGEPPPVATAADLWTFHTALGGSAAPPTALPGGAVRVPEGRADAVLRSLARVPWVVWDGTRDPVSFDLRPLRVCLAADTVAGGLSARIRWLEADGSAAEAPAQILAATPPWAVTGGCLRPVLGAQGPRALARLRSRGVQVPEAELPAFLGTAVPALEAGGIEVRVRGLEGGDVCLHDRPSPRLYLTETARSLVAELAFGYGDLEVAGSNPEPLVQVPGAAGRRFLRRDLEAEFAATLRLRELGLRMTEPGRFEVEGDAAFEFLRRDLGALVRDWEVFGREALRGHRVRSAPVQFRVKVAAGVDWLDLDLEAEAGGDPVAAREFLRALRSRSRYVRLGDGSHAVMPENWSEQVLPLLKDLGVRAKSTRLGRHMAPLLEELAGAVPAVEFAGGAPWERLVAALRGGEAPPAWSPPAGFRGTLRPYQLQGYRWLRWMGELGLGCVLADDMGLGKTVQALALLLAEAEGRRGGPNLVVAPTSVVPNWEAEARRFAPGLRVVRYHGPKRGELVPDLRDRDLVITSYALLRRDLAALGEVPWNYVVLDEAQMIKNAATQTARAATRLPSVRRLALTGTPLENHLGELWSQFQFLAPGLLGSQRRFAEVFARPVAQGDDQARAGLRRRIRPLVLRRMKAEVAPDLPEKSESILWCEMGEEQALLYRTLLEGCREQVLAEVEARGVAGARFSILEALLRLRQVCCHPQVLPGGVGAGVPSAKFDAFQAFAGEVLEEGHRLLVFSQFVRTLGLLREWFAAQGIAHLYLDGSTRDREERVRRFQEDPSVAAFLVSLKAGGTGLNLTGADYVVLFDPWWNPAVETQAADRAHRIGQRNAVFVYKMITRGTVEEKILALQERKRALTGDLIRAGAPFGEGLREEDVEELLRFP